MGKQQNEFTTKVNMEFFDQLLENQENNVVKQDSIQPKVEGSGFDYFDHLFNEQEKAQDLQVKR